MKSVVLNDIKYDVVKDYRDGYDEEAVIERATDYFNDFDYIFGDWAYGKLRLKGFYKNDNENVKDMNNIDKLDDYINNSCAYGCKYFLLEKKK